ncbi:MAG: FHA domain-containing protein [Candidatus Latescibacterota bacterium]
MESIVAEAAIDMIEQKLTQYRALLEQKEELQQWLERAGEQKNTVNDKIYQKVKSEYLRQLSEAESELAPIAEAISKEKESGARQLADIAEELEELKEQHDEAAFRHRVGEYDPERLSQIETSLLPQIDEKKQREAALSELVKQIEKAMNQSVGARSNCRRTAADAAAKISELADPREDLSAQRSNDSALFESAGGPTSLCENNQIPPSAEEYLNGTAAETNSDIDADQMIPFPNLIVISGNQSGKKIPLLPMTMTIGREHDNNIELKDEDVARYHARVIYKQNRFVLEDLNSSTGTWLNNKKINQAALKNNDKLRFGKTEMTIDFS